MTAPSSQVRVGVRIRPITPKESSEGGQQVVQANSFDRTVSLSKRRFTYDSVFDANVSNEDLYGSVAPPLLESFLGGYNATILAYGQTGSGKTYTMGSEAGTSEEAMGLIPRFLDGMFTTLFDRKNESVKSVLQSPLKSNTRGNSLTPSLVGFKVTASFLEVYGEDIYDLLDDNNDRASLKLREKEDGQVFVVGLKKNPVLNAAEAMGILNTGTMNRTTACTLMNHTSSRSHAVFTIHLQQTTRTNEGVDITTSSCMTFVDLAGSERMKKTGAEGERMREGIKINEGLLALGNVINALGDDERLSTGEKVHVPYRQSKLTRLLQDALGGNSQTLFLACVSPSDTNASETISTLQYANRARNIKNAPMRNVDAAALELQRLRALTSILKCELVKHRFDNPYLSPDHENECVNERVVRSEDIGLVDENLFGRDDVLSYLSMIDDKVAELSGSSFINSSAFFSATSTSTPTQSTHSLPSVNSERFTQNEQEKLPPRVTPTLARMDASHHTDDDDDDLSVNPDEDFAIVDELIESRRREQEKIDKMDVEIEEQETRLLQLRDHLKNYVNLKEKYESLLREVNSLENEKDNLMKKLESVQVDPTKGCSVAIKRQLEEVKANLVRARTETRKHQQLYKKAEQEAKKCHVLEMKIDEMKRAKVALIKKQKEEAVKHKQCTNQKTQEIKALKRREKNTDRKVQKLEAECQRYKAILERSQAKYDKLADKLKQTEATLTRLLAKRRQDLNRGTIGSRGVRSVTRNLQQDLDESSHVFAPECGEVNSLKFVLEKTVKDRVDQTQCKQAYESKAAEHDKLMLAMSEEVKILNQLKKQSRELEKFDPKQHDELLLQMRELEENVQGYLIQIEIVEDELEKLRSKWPSVDKDIGTNGEVCLSPRKEESTKQMISRLESPILRTLLWGILESYSKSEIEIVRVKGEAAKRGYELEGVNSQVQRQSDTIRTLTNELRRRSQHENVLLNSPAKESNRLDEVDTQR